MCLTGEVVLGSRNGAPDKACGSMVPGHLMADQPGLPISRKDLRDSPFEIKAKIIGRRVRLSVNGSVPIEGFLIQARQTETSPPIGRFELQSQSNDSIAKYQNCFNNKVIINTRIVFPMNTMSTWNLNTSYIINSSINYCYCYA